MVERVEAAVDGGSLVVQAANRERRWMRMAHIAWAVVVLVDMVAFFISLQPTFELFLQPCLDPQSSDCPVGQAPLADWNAMQAHGVTPTAYAIYTLAVIVGVSLLYFVVGFFIAWRKWRDLMALFVSVTLITFGSTGISDALTNTNSGPLLIGVAQGVIVLLSYPALATFMLTFPSGQFAPRWTVWIVLLWVVQFGLFIGGAPDIVLGLSVAVTWGSCAITQMYRYARLYTPAQRLQTKWVVFGLTIGILISSMADLPPVIWPELTAPGSFYHLSQIVLLAANWAPIPLGVGIAILRYRLYDIDIIINRTLVYGSLTVILAGIYAGVVIGGRWALVAITGAQGGDTPVIVVLSTLVVAAVFQPLRRWLQAAIDRRFYRQKYDAKKAVERFSAALREEVDLPALRERLMTTVEETVQPEHVSLWLREPGRERSR